MTATLRPVDIGRLMAQRAGVLAYGALCYLVFLGTFLYVIGFVGNLLVRSPSTRVRCCRRSRRWRSTCYCWGCSLSRTVSWADAFKRVWTRVVPQHVERTTYVLVSSLLLALLFWQ